MNGKNAFVDAFSAEAGFGWEISEDDAGVVITGYVGKERHVRIPWQIRGLPVISIGSRAFMDKRLVNITIPGSVISIGPFAFTRTNLAHVAIPNSVVSIGRGAFAFNRLSNVNLPDSVAFVGGGAFFDNPIVNITGGPQQDGFFWTKSDGGDSVIITAYMGKEKNIVIPSEIYGMPVVSIGEHAFANAQLSSVEIPNSIVSIENFAFLDNQLTSVDIPNPIAFVRGRAFDISTNVTGGSRKDGFSWADSGDGKSIAIVGYMGNETDIKIPEQIHGLPVTSIGEYAFSHKELASIVIPDSVTSIGGHAFSYNRLTNVMIPNSVIAIEGYAFSGNRLIDINIPDSVSTIGDNAFSLNKLVSVAMGSSVVSIGCRAFSRNELTNIAIPDTIVSIGEMAFFMNQLNDVIIPDSVTSIGRGAFDDEVTITRRNHH